MSEKKTATETGKSRSLRFAVIEVRWSEFFPEVVIGRRDEEWLRQSSSGPRMIGIGFISRKDAEPTLPNSWLRNARRILGHAAVAGVLMFYSGNVVAAAIRAVLGT